MAARILVTGSRKWDDYPLLAATLMGIHHLYGVEAVCHGAASGADHMADDFCKKWGIAVRSYPALWKDHTDGYWCGPRCEAGESATCFSAGPRRNQEMLDDFSPTTVVAFKDVLFPRLGKGGTEDMIARALNENIKVVHVHRLHDAGDVR